MNELPGLGTNHYGFHSETESEAWHNNLDENGPCPVSWCENCGRYFMGDDW